MQILNALRFNLPEIDPQYWQLKSSARSLAYGRFLYEYHQGDQHYWLKTQYMGELQYQHGFRRELQFYQALNSSLAEIVLPYAILDTAGIAQHTSITVGDHSLVLAHQHRLLEQSPQELSNQQIMQCILQLFSCVEVLQQQGWVHGDLKKEHFYVVQGQVRLIDFEQCFLGNEKQAVTLTATPRYMAPELFHYVGKSYASDVYAVGIILLEWLSQQRLMAKDYQAWAVLHCQCLKVELPERFQGFIPVLQWMLKKDWQQRVTDFSALKMRLLLDNV